jgi:hypothetical protein
LKQRVEKLEDAGRTRSAHPPLNIGPAVTLHRVQFSLLTLVVAFANERPTMILRHIEMRRSPLVHTFKIKDFDP